MKAREKSSKSSDAASAERKADAQKRAIMEWAGTSLGRGFSGRDHDEILTMGMNTVSESSYPKAKRSAVRRLKAGTRLGGSDLPSRDELHERGGRRSR